MTHIPYDRVFGTRKHAVQRNRKFDDAEIACEMTAVFTDDFDNRFSDFTGKKRKFGCRKFFNICRGTYAGKDRKKTSVLQTKKTAAVTRTHAACSQSLSKNHLLLCLFFLSIFFRLCVAIF